MMTIPSRLPLHFWSKFFLAGLASVGVTGLTAIPTPAQSSDLFAEPVVNLPLIGPANPDQVLAQYTTNESGILDAESLYPLLEVAVAQKNWSVALDIVQTLQVLQPERSLELQAYRERLQALAGSPTPIPFGGESSSPATPAPFDRDAFLQQVVIQEAVGRVKSTRKARGSTTGQRTVVSTGGGSYTTTTSIPTSVTYPESYEVAVTLHSPGGIPTQRVPVTISINGRPGLTFQRQALLGSSRSSVVKVTFTTDQVSAPRFVIVAVEGGPQQSFSLDLPSSSTPLGERFAN